jgi:putative CocE/NonD family hydrolase
VEQAADAIAVRKNIPGVWESLQQITFRDDRPPAWRGWSMDDWGIHHWAAQVEASKTPMLSWGGWMDAGTADGVLRRFMTLSNPQRVFVGPWNHGGGSHASPFLPPDAPTDPPERQQDLEDLCFLDGVLGRNGAAHPAGKFLVYYTMGEERWKTTREWPIAGTQPQRWYLAGGNTLSTTAPSGATGADSYRVDFEATTGKTNRWATQADGRDVVYADRAEQDQRLLTYTSAPLGADAEFTGHPSVTLYVSSTHTDGAVFVYVEDVAPDGTVRYLTEGMLRAIHRGRSTEPPPYRVLGPYHSFKRKDAMPLVPGETAELSFELMPTSVLVRRGHRVRIAIAGADRDTFRRIPDAGDPVLTIARNRQHASFLELPAVPRR